MHGCVRNNRGIGDEHINLARSIRAHEQAPMPIERHADGPEAGVGTLGIVRVGEDVCVGGIARGWSDGGAVGEGDEGDFVADGLGSVPVCCYPGGFEFEGFLKMKAGFSRGGEKDLPASVKGDPRLLSAAVELDVQRSHVCLECQSRGRSPRAGGIGGGVERELRADGQVAVFRKGTRIPRCEALRVAVVTALGFVRVADQGSVKIHLLAWIVLVDVDTVTHDVIGGVFDRIEPAGFRMLGESDGVAEAPTKAESVGVELVPVGGQSAEVEGLDLAVSSANVGGQRVNVRSASAADQ